jgi:hypothetical protein
VGKLGTSGVGISLDSISEFVSRGVNWLGLSISWGGPVSWGWSRCVCCSWGWDNNRCWGRLFTDNDGFRDCNGGSRNNNWSWGTDEGERSERSRDNTDDWSRSNTDKRSWSNTEDWGSGNDKGARGVCVSVVMTSGSISNDCGHQAGKNNECLK